MLVIIDKYCRVNLKKSWEKLESDIIMVLKTDRTGRPDQGNRQPEVRQVRKVADPDRNLAGNIPV